MKFRWRLIVAMLVVSVLPILLINRYAFAFFHHFSREAQEQSMVHSARLAGKLFVSSTDPAQFESVLAGHAADTESRIRVFAAEHRLALDTGESPGLDLDLDLDVRRAFASGAYAARWGLTEDRSRVYYFVSEPVVDPDTGGVLAVAQVIRHTAPITRALKDMKENQILAVRWAAAGSLALAVAFSALLTLRLRLLRRAARAFAAAGDTGGFELRGRDEFADLAAGFREMAEELEARQAHNREFVLTTLHELKTPLTAIQGAAELLRDHSELDPPERKKFAGNIAVQCERLIRLVHELRALTALDVDLPRESPRVEDLCETVRVILDRVRPAVESELVLRLEEEPLPVRILPHRVEQALVNLLENADRYQPENEPILVRVSREGDTARVAVEDRGPGVAPENLDRIFDRFFTTVPKGQARRQGRGLGLAVVKRIVEAQRGVVFAENLGEGGARVGFALPLVENVTK